MRTKVEHRPLQLKWYCVHHPAANILCHSHPQFLYDELSASPAHFDLHQNCWTKTELIMMGKIVVHISPSAIIWLYFSTVNEVFHCKTKSNSRLCEGRDGSLDLQTSWWFCNPGHWLRSGDLQYQITKGPPRVMSRRKMKKPIHRSFLGS